VGLFVHQSTSKRNLHTIEASLPSLAHHLLTSMECVLGKWKVSFWFGHMAARCCFIQLHLWLRLKEDHHASAHSARLICTQDPARTLAARVPGRLILSALTQLETAHGPCWQAPDLKRLVSSCSHLQKLSLCCSPGLQLSALLQLVDLTQLWLAGNIDARMNASLAELTGLQELKRLAVTDLYTYSNYTLVTLTAFTQLTYLALPHYSYFGSVMQQALLQLCGNTLHYTDRWPSVLCSVITSTVSE